MMSRFCLFSLITKGLPPPSVPCFCTELLRLEFCVGKTSNFSILSIFNFGIRFVTFPLYCVAYIYSITLCDLMDSIYFSYFIFGRVPTEVLLLADSRPFILIFFKLNFETYGTLRAGS
jgi:hypothetical protein